MTDTSTVTLYTTDWCSFCINLVENLDRNGTPFTRINIDEDPEAAAWVESVNNGNRIVPTVKYSDGTYATNPTAGLVRRKYTELTRSRTE